MALRPSTEMGVLSDGGEDATAPPVPQVTSEPTQAEQDDAVYRSWCEHCVIGRGHVTTCKRS